MYFMLIFSKWGEYEKNASMSQSVKWQNLRNWHDVKRISVRSLLVQAEQSSTPISLRQHVNT